MFFKTLRLSKNSDVCFTDFDIFGFWSALSALWDLKSLASTCLASGLLGACCEPLVRHFWPPLAARGPLFGSFGPLLGPSWALFGRLGLLLAVLARSWPALAALEPPLAVLWPLWVGLWAIGPLKACGYGRWLAPKVMAPKVICHNRSKTRLSQIRAKAGGTLLAGLRPEFLSDVLLRVGRHSSSDVFSLHWWPFGYFAGRGESIYMLCICVHILYAILYGTHRICFFFVCVCICLPQGSMQGNARKQKERGGEGVGVGECHPPLFLVSFLCISFYSPV